MDMTQKTSEGERLVKLALLVQERGPISFADIRSQLAEYGFFEGDDERQRKRHDDKVRRMFERDKVTLAECGLFIEAAADSTYTVDSSASFAAPLELTESQASLLRLICSSLLEDSSYQMKAELRGVLAKLSQELEMPDMLPQGSLSSTRDEVMAGFKKVQKAIAQRKRLRFSYENTSGASSSREVEPFGSYFLERRCYVVAFDPSCDEERCFRLDRMSHMSVNSSSSTPDFEARPFIASKWFRLPFQFGAGEFEAEISFDADNAWRAEQLYSQQGSLEEAGEHLVWHVQAADAKALVAWCIENGPGIVPVAPQQVCDAYRHALERVLETHDARSES